MREFKWSEKLFQALISVCRSVICRYGVYYIEMLPMYIQHLCIIGISIFKILAYSGLWFGDGNIVNTVIKLPVLDLIKFKRQHPQLFFILVLELLSVKRANFFNLRKTIPDHCKNGFFLASRDLKRYHNSFKIIFLTNYAISDDRTKLRNATSLFYFAINIFFCN